MQIKTEAELTSEQAKLLESEKERFRLSSHVAESAKEVGRLEAQLEAGARQKVYSGLLFPFLLSLHERHLPASPLFVKAIFIPWLRPNHSQSSMWRFMSKTRFFTNQPCRLGHDM